MTSAVVQPRKAYSLRGSSYDLTPRPLARHLGQRPTSSSIPDLSRRARTPTSIMMSISTSELQTCPILCLPYEVRDLLYHAVLDPLPSRLVLSTEYRYGYKLQTKPSLPISLLRSCRLFHLEGWNADIAFRHFELDAVWITDECRRYQ